ncbi:AcrR family transcriptional regulator [Kitasatospora sp. MAP12-15]|uniref:ScbR family autoregulator-binding transcription factor n=1 Tax=unclassified Kitasatospora TaxID=2633591 RepID=UPI002476DAED|nr:ScbR family autoregulator-binding transcription factor [Kitasatospora sp. MAP12-44]MDH6112141.1 AcrR family transcriptional regulator [Kitasatospora sp. MAP12-44]
MAQQERGIRTRRVILEAAASVFDEFGYEAATIAEILARAHLTKGALYFHFSSKEELARGVLDEAVTTDGVLSQTYRLQELVDTAMALAYRLPREPLLSASIRLSVDKKARAMFGTRWPDWISLLAGLIQQAKENGEVLAHVVPTDTARLVVGAWTGVELVAEGLPEEYSLESEIAQLFDHLLPGIAVPAVLARLDTAADRGTRLVAQARESAQVAQAALAAETAGS